MATDRIARSILELAVEAADFFSSVDKAEKRAGTLEAKFKRAGKGLKDFGAGATEVGKNLSIGLTAPILAAGAGILKVGADYDAALRAISVGTGATGEQLKSLGDDFRATFAAVPESAATVAAAISDINTITGATGTSLSTLTTQVLDASRVLGEDGTANAKGFAQALQQFGLDAKNAGPTLDALFGVAQSTGVGLGQLIGSTNTYGSVLKNAGFTMEESALIFGRLEKSGIAVSRVMPGLNKAFRDWANEGKNAKEELQLTIERMRAAETSSQALAIATETFGAEGAQRMTTAVRNGSFALEDLGTALDGTAGLIGSTTEQNRSLTEQFSLLWREIQTELLPVGKNLIDFLREMMPQFRAVSGVVADVVRWFTNLSPEVQLVIGAVLAIAAALGPVIVGIGTLASGIGTILPILAGLKVAIIAIGTIATGPIGLLIAAVVAAIAVWSNWEEIKIIFGAVKDFIVETAGAIFSGVKGWLVDRFAEIVEGVSEKIQAVKDFFSGLKDAVVGNSFVPEMIAAIGAEFARLDQVMVQTTESATSRTGTLFDELVTKGGDAARTIQSTWKGIMEKWKENTGSTFSFVVQAGADMATGVLSVLQSLGIKGKAIAIAGAVIQTYSAIAKALGAYVWPFNLVAAAAAGLAGWQNVAKIRNAEPGFQFGTRRLDFEQFGPETRVALHGREAVIPKGGGHQLAEEIAASLIPMRPEPMIRGVEEVSVSIDLRDSTFRGTPDENADSIVKTIKAALRDTGLMRDIALAAARG